MSPAARRRRAPLHGIDPSAPLRQDDDVLDTWFSSALWPFSTQGWPEQTQALATYYPTAVLVTGFDIIFFWVARMIMMGLKFTGEVPFREVYVHGLIRDHDGQKMSKSKGNVIDPLDIVDGISLDALLAKRTSGLMQPQMKPAIEKATRKQFPHGIAAFGTDALRLCFARLATQSRDLRFDMTRVEEYRNFCNKLWNAARYVLMNVENQESSARGRGIQPGRPLDSGAARRHAGARRKPDSPTTASIPSPTRCTNLPGMSSAIGIWNSPRPCCNRTPPAPRRSAARAITLINTLEVLLRALHPLAPFISEEIWQRVRASAGVAGETIMRCEFPERRRHRGGPASGGGNALGDRLHRGRAADPRRDWTSPAEPQARGAAAERRARGTSNISTATCII